MSVVLKSKFTMALGAAVALLVVMTGVRIANAGHVGPVNSNVMLTGCLAQGDLSALKPGPAPRVNCDTIPIGNNNHARQVSLAGAGQVDALQAQIAALEARVAALEGPGGGTLPPETTTTGGTTTTTLPGTTTTIVSGASISITKTPPTQDIAPFGTASWTITVENTGTENLSVVRVDDPLAIDCESDIGDLAPGVMVSYACELTGIEFGFTNTADVYSEDGRGAPVTAQATADVTVTPIVTTTIP